MGDARATPDPAASAGFHRRLPPPAATGRSLTRTGWAPSPASPMKVAALRIAVLIKQVPAGESLALGPDRRLVRSGMELEINAYCRRAISHGCTLARESGGSCTVFTLGPPQAEDALREAVAWGADEGVLITGAAFAGSDTLATSRALAAALERCGPFDLILVGRNSVDADTGQVGPQVVELLGLPFLAGVKATVLKGTTVGARLELDDGWADAEVDLPAVLSCAERLCTPAKVDPDGRAAVDPTRLRRMGPHDLGPGPWGAAGSPTQVGAIRVLEVERRRLVLRGAVVDQVAEAVALLRDSGALDTASAVGTGETQPPVTDGWARGDLAVAVLLEPDRAAMARQLLGAAARLARALGGHVVAARPPDSRSEELSTWSAWGADRLVNLLAAPSGPAAGAEDVAAALATWVAATKPWALLAPGTLWGREVAGRLAARLGLGLTGDAIDVAFEDGRLLSWKPAFGGRLVAAITSTSEIQVATVRPGVLPAPPARAPRPLPVLEVVAERSGRVRLLASGRDDELDELATAEAVVGVGAGVDPADYPRLAPLLSRLEAALGATRKVTDQSWQPRSRQIGLTGRSLAPRLYVAIGVSGKFNHLVGVRGAGLIVAINADPGARVFSNADVGIVGDWRQVVPLLVAELE
ncbi:MAG: FAD-binding protein [Acidimicrobiales bacterium]